MRNPGKQMKHPAINEGPELASSSVIPWSAEAEAALRKKVRDTWGLMWVCLITAVVWGAAAFYVHRLVLLAIAGLFLGFGITRLYALALLREKLGEPMRRGPRGEFLEGSGMLANKPRSTHDLTKWMQWPSPQYLGYSMKCECGRLHELDEWKWIPNFDPELFGEAEYPSHGDPGGGRFVILCPCGIGHFKLKPVTEQDIVGDAS
jgi:hypothetical protein